MYQTIEGTVGNTPLVRLQRLPGETNNVLLAKLEGSNPQKKDEYVIYSAHWDHLGRNPNLQGDQIYNGALDNASGIASLLEIAQAFTKLPQPPPRSILFLATTINYLIPQLGYVPVVLTRRMFYLVAWFAVHKLMGNLEPVTIQAAAAGAGALRSVASRSPAATPIR